MRANGHAEPIAGERHGQVLESALLRGIVEHATAVMVVVTAAEHRIWLSNAAFRALLPRALRRVEGRRLRDVLPAALSQAAIPFLDDVFDNGRPLRLRDFAFAVGRRGQRYWDVDLKPLRASAGGVDALVAVASDVTARVRAREKAERMAREAMERVRVAEESERMLDALMACIPEGIAIVDGADLRIRRVSYHGLAMTKRPWQDVIEESPAACAADRWQLYHRDGSTLAEPGELPLARAARNGEIVANEQWMLRQHDGKLVPVLCNAGPVRDTRGRVTGSVMSWLDISSLEESRNRLFDAAKRFELAVDAGDLGMWDHDLLTGEMVWSDRCKAIFGLKPGAAMSYETFMQAVHPEDRERMAASVRRAMDPAGDGEYCIEYRILCADGSERWVEARGRAFFSGQHRRRQAVRLIGTLRDITARVQTAAEREELLQQKDMLLREVNHRVNNSLQLITSLLRLQAETQPADIRAQLDEARTRVQTIGHIHQRLTQSDRFAVVDLATYLGGLISDLSASAGQAETTKLRLTAESVEVPTEMAVSLGLIVNELVTNALKYGLGDTGSNAIEVGFKKQRGRYVLTVRDHGAGLPSGFDPAHSAGLGMRLVVSLVEKLDATLTTSSSGRGARFEIGIPIAGGSSFQIRSGPRP